MNKLCCLLKSLRKKRRNDSDSDSSSDDEDGVVDEEAGEDKREVFEWATDTMGDRYADAACTPCSNIFCFCLPRVGNMRVLSMTSRGKYKAPDLHCMLGPWWPCCMFGTMGIISTIGFFTFTISLRGQPWYLWILFSIFFFGTVGALACTSFNNPGIVPRTKKLPYEAIDKAGRKWHPARWSSGSGSFIPRGAVLDDDCGVAIEEFDHTCPWTGTGIGRGNIQWFYHFLWCCTGGIVVAAGLMIFSAGSRIHHRRARLGVRGMAGKGSGVPNVPAHGVTDPEARSQAKGPIGALGRFMNRVTGNNRKKKQTRMARAAASAAALKKTDDGIFNTTMSPPTAVDYSVGSTLLANSSGVLAGENLGLDNGRMVK